MFCHEGFALFRCFEQAAQTRAEARDAVLLHQGEQSACEETLLATKKSYSDAFVGWVTHRSFCITCRSKSMKEDTVQFASL